MKNSLLTVFIVFLILAASFGVGAATQAGTLIQAAVPFAIALIVIMHFMGPKAELIAWSAFTVGLLGSTYLQTGETVEYAMFFVYILLSVLGLFKSPYFLALAWLFHPVWDFVPRDLPPLQTDLPLACALFDTPIGLYLLWGAWKKHWDPFGANPTNKSALMRAGKTLFIGSLLAATSSVTVYAADAGQLMWIALPMAVIVIAGCRMIGSRAELIAWGFFTGWLGMVFVSSGSALDSLAFFVYVAVAALGVFKSPYFLAIGWIIFIPWSFLPHELTQTYPGLSLAFVLFCLPIGSYLLWNARENRWEPLDNESLTPSPA